MDAQDLKALLLIWQHSPDNWHSHTITTPAYDLNWESIQQMRVYETRAACLDWGSRNAALFKTWSFPATQWRYCWLREVYKSIKTFHFSLSTGHGDGGDGICSKCTYRNGISRKSSIASDIPMSKMLLSESRESAPKVCMSSNWRDREDLSWYFEMWRKLQRYDYHQGFRNKIWAKSVTSFNFNFYTSVRTKNSVLIKNHSSILVIVPLKAWAAA